MPGHPWASPRWSAKPCILSSGNLAISERPAQSGMDSQEGGDASTFSLACKHSSEVSEGDGRDWVAGSTNGGGAVLDNRTIKIAANPSGMLLVRVTMWKER